MSPAYRNIPTDKLKRLGLKNVIREGRGLARSMMLDENRAVGNESEMKRIARARFNTLSSDKRTELNERYKLKYGSEGANNIIEDEAYWFIDE
jgi:hypothetical protein